MSRIHNINILDTNSEINMSAERKNNQEQAESINYKDFKFNPKRVSSTDGRSYWKSATSESLKNSTIGQLVENSASKFAHRIAISMQDGQKLTYTQMEEKTNTLAAAFLGLGIEKGDRIAIIGFNSIEWYLSFIAAVKAGLITVNVNPLFEAPELKSCLLLSGAKAVILCEDSGEHLHSVLSKVAPEILDFDENTHVETIELPEVKVIISTSDQRKVLLNSIPEIWYAARALAQYSYYRSCSNCRNSNFRESTVFQRRGAFSWHKLFDLVKKEHRQKLNKIRSNENVFDVCNIQFTSGTTNTPKGVMLTHHNLVNNGYWFGKSIRLNEKHHKACALPPFFHSYGLSLEIIGSISHGATIVIPFNRYSSTKVVSCLIENRCSLIYGTPTMFIDLLSQLNHRAQKDQLIYEKLSCVERILTGGAICLPEVIENLRKHLPWVKISSGYGMTELSPATFVSMPDEPPDMVFKSTGRLLDHMETKIVDQDRKIVPLGTPGELCFRGYMVMKGYYKNPEKTAEVIDNDGWFYTGDRAILLENGYAQIVGRIKDIINRGGEKVQPKEVEEIIMKHPAVLDVQVYGVSDHRLGEVVAANIMKDENLIVTEEDIRQFCTGVVSMTLDSGAQTSITLKSLAQNLFIQIASYKIPKYIVFCKDFPRTASGKIQKFQLKNKLEKELGLKKQIE